MAKPYPNKLAVPYNPADPYGDLSLPTVQRVTLHADMLSPEYRAMLQEMLAKDTEARERAAKYALPEDNANTVWVANDGRKSLIGEMHENYVRNCLAMIVKRLRHDNQVAYIGETGRVVFATRMQHLVDNKDSFLDEGGNLNEF